MSAALLALFGWLVPGGGYLLMRRYLQFAVFAFIVYRALRIALRARSDYEFFLAAGLAAATALQILLISGGALGVTPGFKMAGGGVCGMGSAKSPGLTPGVPLAVPLPPGIPVPLTPLPGWPPAMPRPL